MSCYTKERPHYRSLLVPNWMSCIMIWLWCSTLEVTYNTTPDNAMWHSIWHTTMWCDTWQWDATYDNQTPECNVVALFFVASVPQNVAVYIECRVGMLCIRSHCRTLYQPSHRVVFWLMTYMYVSRCMAYVALKTRHLIKRHNNTRKCDATYNIIMHASNILCDC